MATSVTPERPGTALGGAVPSNPSPNCPAVFPPHRLTEPSVRTAHALDELEALLNPYEVAILTTLERPSMAGPGALTQFAGVLLRLAYLVSQLVGGRRSQP